MPTTPTIHDTRQDAEQTVRWVREWWATLTDDEMALLCLAGGDDRLLWSLDRGPAVIALIRSMRRRS
jgi:hypothetical protein